MADATTQVELTVFADSTTRAEPDPVGIGAGGSLRYNLCFEGSQPAADPAQISILFVGFQPLGRSAPEPVDARRGPFAEIIRAGNSITGRDAAGRAGHYGYKVLRSELGGGETVLPWRNSLRGFGGVDVGGRPP